MFLIVIVCSLLPMFYFWLFFGSMSSDLLWFKWIMVAVTLVLLFLIRYLEGRPYIFSWSLVYSFFIFLFLFYFFTPLLGKKKAASFVFPNNHISLTLLQLNDVYEIAGIDKGQSGGLARVAWLRDSMAAANPGTVYTVMAGDFLSPSAMGTIKDTDNKAIAGRQMVSVLNRAGLDLATFGNHEFDLNRSQLQECIDSARFDWITANTKDSIAGYARSFVKNKDGAASPIPPVIIKEFTDEDGTKVKIGFFGITIKSSAGAEYVSYSAYDSTAAAAIALLKNKCDLIIAITHLSLPDDLMLAKKFPEISMVIGGHEHVNSYNTVGKTPITKADANAKTVYLHTLDYNTSSKQLNIQSRLVTINNKMAKVPAVDELIENWNKRADSLLSKKLKPCQATATLPRPFDGTEESIRKDTTSLTLAIGLAMAEAVKPVQVDCALYNSGSIRIDDWLKGTVTQYDLFRVLPYTDTVKVAAMKGWVLDSLLNVSTRHPGEGCFLQHDGRITKEKNKWKINKEVINLKKDYRVAINGYLLKGKQEKMTFIKDNARLVIPGKPKDAQIKQPEIIQAVIQYFSTHYPPQSSSTGNLQLPCY